MGQPVKTYRLAAKPADAGLYCDLEGLTLAGVPLVIKSHWGFEPRSPVEVRSLLDAAYGDPAAEFGRFFAGISTVANALNNRDLPLAMIASVLTRLPELDSPGLARLRIADSLLKATFNPLEPRDERGKWTTGGAGDGASPNPNTEVNRDQQGSDETDFSDLIPVQYRGNYHDQVVGELFRAIIADGGIASLEVPFTDFLGNGVRLDLLVFDLRARPPLYGIEVKTGPGARYTIGQATVYPQIVLGGNVSSFDQRLSRFGLNSGGRLPPIPIWTYWKPAPEKEGIWIPIIPEFEKLLSSVFFFV